jgi:hypothetical protein
VKNAAVASVIALSPISGALAAGAVSHLMMKFFDVHAGTFLPNLRFPGRGEGSYALDICICVSAIRLAPNQVSQNPLLNSFSVFPGLFLCASLFPFFSLLLISDLLYITADIKLKPCKRLTRTAPVQTAQSLWAVAGPCAYLFLCIMHREILMDINDVEGDREAGVYTLPVVLGRRAALGAAAAFAAAAVGACLRAAAVGTGLAWLVSPASYRLSIWDLWFKGYPVAYNAYPIQCSTKLYRAISAV